MRLFTLTAVALCLATFARAENSQPLVVHEWGTFTSLQDEQGQSISGIEEDVEPLPSFVKSLGGPTSNPKGLPATPAAPSLASNISRPDITMRLETPVVYFHLPPGSPPISVDFSATFHGGLLSQWYPITANNDAAIIPSQITANTVNRLTWKNIAVGAKPMFVQTDSHVWLAPRKVASDPIAVNGQSEQYLFYRGVGHLDAPLKVVRDGGDLWTTVRSDVPPAQAKAFFPSQAWLVDIRSDEKCAFRKVLIDSPRMFGEVRTPAEFHPSDYEGDRLTSLHDEMKASLLSAGLYEDEAEAMLNTWRESYFKSSGLRVFFIVPRAWTDEHLPIQLSVPAKIERVMVGRIDLVTPMQRELAQKYLELSEAKDRRADEVFKQIGRFAHAILADEKAKKPSAISLSN